MRRLFRGVPGSGGGERGARGCSKDGVRGRNVSMGGDPGQAVSPERAEPGGRSGETVPGDQRSSPGSTLAQGAGPAMLIYLYNGEGPGSSVFGGLSVESDGATVYVHSLHVAQPHGRRRSCALRRCVFLGGVQRLLDTPHWATRRPGRGYRTPRDRPSRPWSWVRRDGILDGAEGVSATLENEADPTLDNEAIGSVVPVCRRSWVLMLGRVSIPRLRSR